MDEEKMDQSLIECVLPLLNHRKNAKEEKQSGNDIRIAQKMIRFMDEMPGGLLIYRADGEEEIIYANRALLRIFQCDTLEEFREWTGNSFQGLVYEEDLQAVEESICEQIANSQYDLDYVEYRILAKDGNVRWVEDYGHFIHSEEVGDLFYVFISDATERILRQMTEKSVLLNEKEEKEKEIQNLTEEYNRERKEINQEYLRRLEVIEGLSVNYESILYVDLNTDKIVPYRLSSRTQLQFERKFESRSFLWYVSNYVEVWVHPEDRERVRQMTSIDYIRKKLLKQNTYYVNYRVINKGKIQYLQLRIVNVGTGEQISQIVFGYRKVDEEIRREMEQKQILEEALDNANMAITAKNAFLSNMSHDMRTPLNAIFGYTDLARKHIENAKTVQTYLDKIEASGKQLLDLIDKVLKISWTEANEIQIEEAQCNLCNLVREVYEDLFFPATEKNIRLSLNLEQVDHADVYCDPDKLKQILRYLLDNAVTYTQNSGEVEIRVLEVDRLPNDYAVYQFAVKDTGVGIDKEFLEHIFEPFEREKNSTFSGAHGMGLGLTIARNIVKKMGGKIEIDSTIGEGSIFTVTLTLRMCNINCFPMEDTDKIIDSLMDRKILLVEDNEINLEIETEILRELGFLVDTAENGSIAVEKVKNSKPGEYFLILMDIQMPVMDGREAAVAIQGLKNPDLARIPIIALSADAFESDRRLSIECGMAAHLPKPIDVPLLLETIAKTIQKYRMLYEK